MRLCSLLVLAALGCGGSQPPAAPAPSPATQAYAATRWLPATPSYAFAARTVREAQQSLRDAIDGVGMFGDLDAAKLSVELRAMLRVDLLSPEALADIGIDLEGGIAMFSEALDPTIVVHLSSAAQFQGFLDQQAQLQTQSIVVDGVELFTAQLPGRVRVSWAVADDWLWLHLDLPGGPADDGAAWFLSSRRPGAPTWGADWAWAQGQAAPAVVGFLDPQGLLGQLPTKGADAAACLRLLEPVARVGLALDAGPQQLSAQLAFDLGPSAASIARASLPIPEGWAAATAQVPIAAQWNLDLAAVRQTIAPCARTFGLPLTQLDELGIRAGRAFVRSFDPDDRSGSGVVSLELAHARFFAAQLDQIPLRKALERKQQFGPYAGRTLKIPMFLTVDYVLTDVRAFAAVGDGLLAAVVGNGVTVPGPVFALELQPLGLTREAWTGLLELAEVPQAGRVAERLLRWRAAHLALTVDGTRLVLSASGTRR